MPLSQEQQEKIREEFISKYGEALVYYNSHKLTLNK